MFVRRAHVKGHAYLVIVEGYRWEGRVRHRTIRYLGRADRWTREEVQAVVAAARAEAGPRIGAPSFHNGGRRGIGADPGHPL